MVKKITKKILFVITSLLLIIIAVASYTLVLELINIILEIMGLEGRFLPHIILILISTSILVLLGISSKTISKVVLRK